MFARFAVIAATALIASADAPAQIVFSTFGPGGTFPGNFFYQLTAPTVERLGWRFSPSESGQIANVVAPINSFSPVVDGILEVYRADAPVPGTLLGTLQTLLPPSGFRPPRLATFLPTEPITILQGESYYLALVRTPPRTLEWFSVGLSGPQIEQIYQPAPGAAWEVANRQAAVFSVSIPAPACSAALGMLGFVAARRRR